MDRKQWESLVKAKTVRVGKCSAVSLDDARELLGCVAFKAMMADADRSAGPREGYVYPRNVVDYLSGAIEVKSAEKGDLLMPFVFIADYLGGGSRVFGFRSADADVAYELSDGDVRDADNCRESGVATFLSVEQVCDAVEAYLTNRGVK